MKQITLIILVITFSMSLNAQEKQKQREVGITFSNFENFGFTYKTGTSNSLWRLSTLRVSGENFIQPHDTINSGAMNHIGFSVGFGREYRKEITKNLEMRFGADLNFQYGYSIEKFFKDNNTYYTAGLNLVFGLNYVFNNNIIMGAELLPGVSYTSTRIERALSSDIDYTRISYGLSSNSALLSFAYRF